MVAMRADEGWQVAVTKRNMQEEGDNGRKDEDKHSTTLFRLGSFMHDASQVHSSTCGFHHMGESTNIYNTHNALC